MGQCFCPSYCLSSSLMTVNVTICLFAGTDHSTPSPHPRPHPPPLPPPLLSPQLNIPGPPAPIPSPCVLETSSEFVIISMLLCYYKHNSCRGVYSSILRYFQQCYADLMEPRTIFTVVCSFGGSQVHVFWSSCIPGVLQCVLARQTDL